jgi:hypothetical protein|tara:strand:+ start:233 stop:367 length:135 start_codon:yes stop_codon:yes gene_type:complete
MFEISCTAPNGTIKRFVFDRQEKAQEVKKKLIELGWVINYSRAF